MSETLRDLVVSLSLQTDNFTRNINSVNKQIREAESAFKLAAAGVENFEKTTSGLAAKQTTLTRQLELQKTAVEQHQKALEAAKQKLADCKAHQAHYTQALADANAELQKSEQEHGKESEQYKKAEANVKKLTGQVEKEKTATQNASDAVSTAAAKLNNAEAQVRTLQAALAKNGIELTAAEKGFYAAGFAIEGSEKAVASLGKQMQLAESKFRLAGAGIDNFGRKSSGAAAKLDLLKDKQKILRQQVDQLRDAVKNAQTQLEAANASGDSEKIREAKDKLTELNTTLNNTEAELRAVTHELNRQSSVWTRAGNSLVNFSSGVKKVSGGLNSFGRTMTRSVTTPLVTLGTAAVKASIDFEDSFASVRKTVDATEDDFERLAAASKQMSTEVAASTSEINEVMATGGQLGVSAGGLAEFTRVMIDLGNSCEDLSATDAATMLAKFANIMDSGEKQYKNMGSTLVALGNNFATTEGDIMELAMRLAGAGKQVGLSEAQVLGFATALSSVGINAEAGGSAFSKALVQMEVAAATGGQALDDFAKVSGMTADEFKTLWDSNPAAAFQAFIEGLAQLDDEGESAIVVLNEIGISEVRLRDTMLRSVNATELFARALGLAGEAWDENNALTEEANKRYATTASKLTNLKNKAVLVAQQLGDDMNPTIQNLIGSVSDLLDKFMGLDEQQRMSIVKWGAVAASIGPAVLVMGKVTGVVGSVTGAVGKGMQAIGKFSGAVKDAGGGMTGLVKVVGSSPGKMAALTVAVIAVAAAIYDVASGAKAAREALEGMNKTANEWKNTAAETFYGSGEGLGFFDMSADDFVASTKQTAKVTTTAVQDWMDGMIAVWSDGKYETDAIVKEWQDSSSEVSKETLEHMKELRTQAQESGDTAKAQELDADIAALEALDKRISDNLRFFQGKKLTDANKAFWQSLMNEKQEILLKWGFAEEPIGGNEAYETIANKVRAAEARAAAMEQEVDSSLYEEATLATAQGYAAILQQINDEYDAEYAKIQQITDASERQARQNALDEDYTKKRADAAKEYGAATQEYMAKVLNSDGVENTKDQLTKLKDLLSDLAELSPTDTQGRANILSQLNELTEGMDEGALTEYLTMLTQVGSQIALLESSGMDDADIQALFPSIELDEIKKALALYSEIGEYLYKFRNEDEISPLNTMLNEAIPEEVLTITADLNLDGAKASWEAFAANPGSPITTDVQVRPSLRGTISLTGYDYMAYKGFTNKNEELEIDGRIRLGNVTEAQWETALGEGRVKYYKDGVEVDANVALASDIDENTLALLTRDEDGTITYNVLIATQVTGDKEAIDAVSALVDEEEKIAPTLLGQAAGIMPTTLMGLITSATERIQSYQKTKDWSGWDKFWANLLYGESTDLGVLNTSMELDFSQDSVAELSAYIGEMVAAIQQGKAVSEDDLNNLKLIFEFLNGLQDTGTGTHILTGAAEGVTAGGITSTVDTVVENLGAAIQTAESQINGVGEDIAAGIGEGQANYDFANDAETTISNDEAALRTAADSHSPAVRMKPLGADIAAGIGEGMAGYDFSAYASSTVGSLQSAMSAALLSGSLRSVGVNAMYGMAAGIRAGRANVISAMRSAAQAAVSAAKTALQIHSPSRVFRDEVGAMTMKGFGEGVLDETKEQAKVISNAARYLTHAAGSSAIAATNDNRKTYNTDNSTSFSFAGATFSVRSDQDVHDLAVEIATLTRRNQRGRGYRMA